MSLAICTRCGRKTSVRDFESGYCVTCMGEVQEQANRRQIMATSMPNGVITRWNASPSFLDKKNNYMYFRIPPGQTLYFDPTKHYEIIVKECEVS